MFTLRRWRTLCGRLRCIGQGDWHRTLKLTDCRGTSLSMIYLFIYDCRDQGVWANAHSDIYFGTRPDKVRYWTWLHQKCFNSGSHRHFLTKIVNKIMYVCTTILQFGLHLLVVSPCDGCARVVCPGSRDSSDCGGTSVPLVCTWRRTLSFTETMGENEGTESVSCQSWSSRVPKLTQPSLDFIGESLLCVQSRAEVSGRTRLCTLCRA